MTPQTSMKSVKEAAAQRNLEETNKAVLLLSTVQSIKVESTESSKKVLPSKSSQIPPTTLKPIQEERDESMKNRKRAEALSASRTTVQSSVQSSLQAAKKPAAASSVTPPKTPLDQASKEPIASSATLSKTSQDRSRKREVEKKEESIGTNLLTARIASHSASTKR